MTVTVSRVLEGAFSAAAGVSGLTGFIMLFSALMHSGLIGIYTKFAFSGRGIGGICLSSIILSPLNGYVKMSPYETGDICIEPERIATSGGDFILREGGPGVCQSRLTAQPNASTCQTTQISVTARR